MTIQETKMLMEVLDRLDKIIELLTPKPPVSEVKIPKHPMSDASAKTQTQLGCGLLSGKYTRWPSLVSTGYRVTCDYCHHGMMEDELKKGFICPNH